MYFRLVIDEECNIIGKIPIKEKGEMTTKQLKEIVTGLQDMELHTLHKLYIDTGQSKRKEIIEWEAERRGVSLSL